MLVAVSACLLGARVRYDGQSKPHTDALTRLEPHVRWLPLCPEVVAGWGVPRPPVQLEGTVDAVRVVGRDDRIDRTASLERTADGLARQVLAQGIVGAVLKARSPSCGRALALPGGGTTDGRLVAALLRLRPDLPVFDEQALATPERLLAALYSRR